MKHLPPIHCTICFQKLHRDPRSGRVSPEAHRCTDQISQKLYDTEKGRLVAVRMKCPYCKDAKKGNLFKIYGQRRGARGPGRNRGGLRRHIGLQAACKGSCHNDICNFFRNNPDHETEYLNVKAVVDFYLQKVEEFVEKEKKHENSSLSRTETSLWMMGKWLSQSFIHQLLVSLQKIVGDNNVVLMSHNNSEYLGLKLGGTKVDTQRAEKYLEIFIHATPKVKLLKHVPASAYTTSMNSESNQNFSFAISGHLFDTRAMAAFLQKLFDLKIHFMIPKLQIGLSDERKSNLHLTLLQVTGDQMEDFRKFLLEFKNNNPPAEMKFDEHPDYFAELQRPNRKPRVYLAMSGHIFLSRMLGTIMQNESNRIFHICPGATKGETTRLIMICKRADVKCIKEKFLWFNIEFELLTKLTATQERIRHERKVQEMMLRSPYVEVDLRKRDESSPPPFAKLGTSYEDFERQVRSKLGARLQISVPDRGVCILNLFLGEDLVLMPNLSEILCFVEKHAVLQPKDVSCRITLRNTPYAQAPNVATRIIEDAKKVSIVVVETESGVTAQRIATLLINGNHGGHVRKVLMAVHPNSTQQEANQIREIAESNELLECVTISAETRMHKESLLRGALIRHLHMQEDERMPEDSEIAMIFNANRVRNLAPQFCIQLIRRRDLADFDSME